jgi:transcriptional regulator with XRE-family HTH domain
MVPFGETVLAWRLARGMSQAALAKASRIPRPNLSAVERGDREVTLKTLRALALALDVRPGVLADGIPPGSGGPALSRTRLERIARAAVGGVRPSDAREAGLADNLRRAMTERLRPDGRAGRRRGPGADADRAYFILKTSEPRDTVASLVDRASLVLRRS